MMTAVVPRLLESGFSKKEIETFLVRQPPADSSATRDTY